jgi:hypothetical protein
METTRAELALLLQRLDRAPDEGSARLRAAVLANRLAALTRDIGYTDVAETVASDEAAGATRSLDLRLREQAHLAREIRRAIVLGEPCSSVTGLLAQDGDDAGRVAS